MCADTENNCWQHEASISCFSRLESFSQEPHKATELVASTNLDSRQATRADGKVQHMCQDKCFVKAKFICIAHFMYKTIQSALHKIKALQRGAEKALKICKNI